VKGLSAAYAVKPVQAREQTIINIESHMSNQEAAYPVGQQHQREASAEDRRKICRRVSYLPVLVELRSGIDRRRRNLRVQDIVDHIDEKV
jgi:hypothetical protein